MNKRCTFCFARFNHFKKVFVLNWKEIGLVLFVVVVSMIFHFFPQPFFYCFPFIFLFNSFIMTFKLVKFSFSQKKCRHSISNIYSTQYIVHVYVELKCSSYIYVYTIIYHTFSQLNTLNQKLRRKNRNCCVMHEMIMEIYKNVCWRIWRRQNII